MERDSEKTELQTDCEYFYHKTREARVSCLDSGTIIEKNINELFIRGSAPSLGSTWGEGLEEELGWGLWLESEMRSWEGELEWFKTELLWIFMLEGGSEKCRPSCWSSLSSLFLDVFWLWEHEVNETIYLWSPSKLIWIVYMVAQGFKRLNRCRQSILGPRSTCIASLLPHSTGQSKPRVKSTLNSRDGDNEFHLLVRGAGKNHDHLCNLPQCI